ncbi:MAG: glycosyltransferase [Micromonosporaceae bacterium]
MRVLFSFAGGRGHFEPLVPIARAAVAAGHTVAFTGEPALLPTVREAGFTEFASGSDTSRTSGREPLAPLDPVREDRAIRDGYAGRLARSRAADLVALAQTWRPDVVVCDEVDFGAMVAAEKLGIRYASVVVIAAGSFIRPELVAEPLHALRAEYDLPPDPELTMLSRHLVLSPAPASFRDPRYPLPPTGHVVRLPQPATAPPADDALAWLAERTGPTVYFTLGTVFNLESGDLFGRVLAGLRELPVNLLVTVGGQLDPAELGPQPAHVRVARFLPQGAVLPYCTAVVSHGGSGSVLGALTHGLPCVLFPMGADQPHNAARCEALGMARVLDPVAATPSQVRDATAAVLTHPDYRRAAGRLRDEIAAAPGPEHAVHLLEQLAG